MPVDGPLPPELERVGSVRQRTQELVEGVCRIMAGVVQRHGVHLVLDHLLLSDAIYRRDFRRLFELARAGEKAEVRRSFSDLNPSVLFFPKALLPLLEPPLAVANLFLPQSVRDWVGRARWIPAQNPDQAAPRPGRPAGALRRELAESLAETEALFADAADLDLASMHHYHPLLGHRDVAGLLTFVADHEERHQAQIRDALGAADHGDSGEEACPCASS